MIRRRYYRLIPFVLGIISLLIPLTSYLQSNAAYLLLNNDLGNGDRPHLLFDHAISLYGMNQAGQRGEALLAFRQNELHKAVLTWQKTDMGVKEFTVFANWAYQTGELATAVQWLKLAEQLDPTHPELWYVTGQVCQQGPDIDPICQEFLVHNNQNWLLNTNFNYHRDRWQVQRTYGFEADYLVVDCPDKPGELCGYVGTETAVPEHGLSWSQCLQVEPHQTYIFSAWVKVQVETGSQWQPIYIQGKKDGKPHGIGLPIQKNASDWHYWENSIAGNEFDDSHVCFYPLRLLSTGQAWFYGATLIPQTTTP